MGIPPFPVHAIIIIIIMIIPVPAPSLANVLVPDSDRVGLNVCLQIWEECGLLEHGDDSH